MRKLWFSYGRSDEVEQPDKSLLHLNGIDPDNFKTDNCMEDVYKKYMFWDTAAPNFIKLRGVLNKYQFRI